MTKMEFDKPFIRKLIKHDRDAQKAFYKQLAPKMYGICLRFASDRDEADDILQEGFIRVFNHLKDFRGEGSLEGWVRRTMVNTAINIYKKRIKKGIAADIEKYENSLSVKPRIVEKISADELLELIKELPLGYRTIFNLSVIDGYTHKEIGLKLNISENTSKSQLSRARTALQKKLQSIKDKENLD